MEAQVACLATIAAGDAKERAEEELARVRDALAVTEEFERTSLLMDIRAAKDEVSSLQSQAVKDKEAMEEDYQKALELIFSYGLRVLCVQTQHMWTPARGSKLDG